MRWNMLLRHSGRRAARTGQPGRHDLYSLGLMTGVIDVTFTNLGGTSFNPSWRLIQPSGVPALICGSFASGNRTCIIDAAGSVRTFRLWTAALTAAASID